MTTHGPHYRVPFRRRREGRTDYRLRARLLRGGRARAVVRKTLSHMIVQVVEADPAGDRVVASANSRDLVKLGWAAGTGNVPAAYLTGFLAAKRATAKGVSLAILDIGLHKPARGGRVFAALQGLLDGGLTVPHSPEVLPTKARLRGEHISEAVPKAFDEIKAKLEAGA